MRVFARSMSRMFKDAALWQKMWLFKEVMVCNKMCNNTRSKCLKGKRLSGKPSSKRLGVLSRVDLDGEEVWG